MEGSDITAGDINLRPLIDDCTLLGSLLDRCLRHEIGEELFHKVIKSILIILIIMDFHDSLKFTRHVVVEMVLLMMTVSLLMVLAFSKVFSCSSSPCR